MYLYIDISMCNLWLIKVLFYECHVFFYVCTAFMLATQLNYLPQQNFLVNQCICKLKKSVASTLSDGRY